MSRKLAQRAVGLRDKGEQERITVMPLESLCCRVELLMPGTLSIVPNEDTRSVYIVLDDIGRGRRAYREADAQRTDLEAVIMDMLEGQYQNPVRVVGFNTAEKWSEDVSGDVAHELRQRCDLQLRDVPFYLEEFVERYEGRYYDIQLPLPIRPL